jgi:hypothetical protein
MPAGTPTAALLLGLLGLGACATPELIPAGPPAWREGYAAGCDSAASVAGDPSRRYVRDAARVEADAAYARGWRAGYDACQRRREEARVRP